MDLTRTAFGTWNGGRFMHFGEPLSDDRFLAVTRRAYEKGIRTFMTADVYGNGAADEMLARALEGFPRDSYCLVGAIGHDFYATKRDGAKGFPRFTDPRVRQPQDFGDYLQMAAEKSLQRLKISKLDCLLDRLSAEDGVTISELMAATGWLPHSTRAALTGLRQRGYRLDLTRRERDGVSVYRIAAIGGGAGK